MVDKPPRGDTHGPWGAPCEVWTTPHNAGGGYGALRSILRPPTEKVWSFLKQDYQQIEKPYTELLTVEPLATAQRPPDGPGVLFGCVGSSCQALVSCERARWSQGLVCLKRFFSRVRPGVLIFLRSYISTLCYASR